MKRIAVVILNWNGRKMLEEFLPSVVEYSREEAEVIIADNASTDDSLAWLATHYPHLRTIVLSTKTTALPMAIIKRWSR